MPDMLPAGVSTFELTFGQTSDYEGVSLRTQLTIVPSHEIRTAAGERIVPAVISAVAPEGEFGSIDLPQPGQTGLFDLRGNLITNWWYTITGTDSKAGRTVGTTKVWRVQPTVDQLVVDLDVLPTDATVSPVGSVVPPAVTSVNGLTGAVSGAAILSALQGELVSMIVAGVAADVANPAGAVPAAIAAEHARDKLFVAAGSMVIATGSPSLAAFVDGSAYYPAWSMSGITSGQSLACAFPGFRSPAGVGVKIEAIIAIDTTTAANKAVFRGSAYGIGSAPSGDHWLGAPVTTDLPGTEATRRVNLSAFVPIASLSAPFGVRVTRENADPLDTFTSPVGLVGIEVSQVVLPDVVEVQGQTQYNSWPFLISDGDDLIAVYSKGVVHMGLDTAKSVVRRKSSDGGQTWGSESVVVDTSGVEDTATGRGKDSNGDLLVWVRRDGIAPAAAKHYLYRSTNGGDAWSLISSPVFATVPVQISDIFTVPSVGLFAFFHAGTYVDGDGAWGYVKSADNGVTWTQTVVESGLAKNAWPTEISGAYIGSNKILAIGRRENTDDSGTGGGLFQLESSNNGTSWTKRVTRITDNYVSTPSFIYDSATGMASVYYFRRGWGVVLRRQALANSVFGAGLAWGEPEAVAATSTAYDYLDTGNVNAVAHDGAHHVAFYAGVDGLTGIYTANDSEL